MLSLLNPFGVTVIPERKTTDFGESDWVAIAPIANAVFALDEPTTVDESAHMQTGTLFVPRGSDLKDGDRITYQNKLFGVIGDAQWDMDTPFGRNSFGYVAYSIRVGG